MLRLGAVKGTIVATAIVVCFSVTLAVIITVFLHRLSWMGVFISFVIPLVLAPMHWYPAARLSEQLQAAQALLRKSEARYRSILEKMNEAYVEIDPGGRLTFFNDSLCRMTGYARAELEQRKVADFIAPRVFRRLLSRAGRVRRSETVGGIYDCPISGQDGSTRFLDASFSPLLDEEGRWSGYRAVLFDVTDKIREEQEKKALEHHLLRAKRMESLGILAGGVAHDLNNILCGIVGYPDMLLLDCTEDGLLRKSLLAIKESGEKAAAVVQDLLTLSRRGVMVTEMVNVNEIVTDYLKSPEHAQLQSTFPDIRVTTELNPDLFNIDGSSHHLFTSITNLVLNAFEAILPPGTVSLTTGNRYLDRPVQGYDHVKPGEYVTLTVADSGVGISPEDAERIFEPFYTRKVMGRSGTGLGMAIVWGTVKDHQGYIIVQSTIGQGTTITLFFPASRRELPAREPAPGIKDYVGNGEQILVVDDMLEQTELIAAMLKRLGYRVHTVSSGEAAVGYLANGTADLMILDMIMDPGMDGLDTYRKVRILHPGLKVIIASGFSETDRVREAQRLGVGPYIKKPFRLETLAKAVHTALRS